MGVTSRRRPIVVGVDGSAQSAAAATATARQARPEFRPVRLEGAAQGTSAPVHAAATGADSVVGVRGARRHVAALAP